jgi:BirA family biotin operon repressor/biotin-[acetyl-CoA-carboxylase] ligase
VPPYSGWRKCGGILAETAAPVAVVLGIGLNVLERVVELPPAPDPRAHQPTSLALAGSSVDREGMAVAMLRSLDRWYGRWLTAGGDAHASGLWGAYRDSCHTLGRRVTAVLPGGASLDGTAVDIDADGRLLLMTAQGTQPLTAADVYHVR